MAGTSPHPAGRDAQLCRTSPRRSASPARCAPPGSANGANPVAVLVPCHRVVRSDGSLGGYAYGLERKRKLLEGEGAVAPSLDLKDAVE